MSTQNQQQIQMRLNGETLRVTAGLTVSGLLERLKLTAGAVAVEVNGEIVPRAECATRVVPPEAVIEIVHFVGGG